MSDCVPLVVLDRGRGLIVFPSSPIQTLTKKIRVRIYIDHGAAMRRKINWEMHPEIDTHIKVAQEIVKELIHYCPAELVKQIDVYGFQQHVWTLDPLVHTCTPEGESNIQCVFQHFLKATLTDCDGLDVENHRIIITDGECLGAMSMSTLLKVHAQMEEQLREQFGVKLHCTYFPIMDLNGLCRGLAEPAELHLRNCCNVFLRRYWRLDEAVKHFSRHLIWGEHRIEFEDEQRRIYSHVNPEPNMPYLIRLSAMPQKLTWKTIKGAEGGYTSLFQVLKYRDALLAKPQDEMFDFKVFSEHIVWMKTHQPLPTSAPALVHQAFWVTFSQVAQQMNERLTLYVELSSSNYRIK